MLIGEADNGVLAELDFDGGRRANQHTRREHEHRPHIATRQRHFDSVLAR
jgi:hypothetical protein